MRARLGALLDLVYTIRVRTTDNNGSNTHYLFPQNERITHCAQMRGPHEAVLQLDTILEPGEGNEFEILLGRENELSVIMSFTARIQPDAIRYEDIIQQYGNYQHTDMVRAIDVYGVDIQAAERNLVWPRPDGLYINPHLSTALDEGIGGGENAYILIQIQFTPELIDDELLEYPPIAAYMQRRIDVLMQSPLLPSKTYRFDVFGHSPYLQK